VVGGTSYISTKVLTSSIIFQDFHILYLKVYELYRHHYIRTGLVARFGLPYPNHKNDGSS